MTYNVFSGTLNPTHSHSPEREANFCEPRKQLNEQQISNNVSTNAYCSKTTKMSLAIKYIITVLLAFIANV